MSAPVTERARTAVRGRTAAIPEQRGTVTVPAPRVEPTSARRSAQQKAYARRDDRLRRVAGERAAAPAGRPQFVLLIMVLLAVGLVATLWLSTAAAADSYRLQDATAEARVLSEQAERLHREVAVLASAPELARRAAELGMTPVQDPARLVVAPDGGVDVVGEPRAAVAPPPPAPPAPPAGEQPPVADGATPDGATPDGAAQDGATPEGTGTDGNEDADDVAQLAAPGADTGGAAAEGARADGAGDAGADTTGADAGQGGGEPADRAPSGAGDGATETGPGASGAGGGGTDAG